MKFNGWRAYIVAITVCGTILGALLLWQLPQSATGPKLFAVFILASYGGGYGVLMSLQIANTAGYTKRSLGSSGMFVGYCLGTFPHPSPLSSPSKDLTSLQAISSVPWSSKPKKHLATTPAGPQLLGPRLVRSYYASSTVSSVFGKTASETRRVRWRTLITRIRMI